MIIANKNTGFVVFELLRMCLKMLTIISTLKVTQLSLNC